MMVLWLIVRHKRLAGAGRLCPDSLESLQERPPCYWCRDSSDHKH